jgi:hypothetical protein
MIAMVKCRIDAPILLSASVIIEVGHEIRKNERTRDFETGVTAGSPAAAPASSSVV